LEIAPQLSESFFPVTVPDSYCISDIFYACKNLLLGKKKHVCGKVYGFLAAPYYAKEPTAITDKELIIAAKSISDEGFLPEYLWADDKKIGPADFIRASIAILSGEKSYTVSPSEPWQIDLDQFPKLRDLSYKNSWIHTKYLEDNFLSERLRLQSWTLRLPKGSDRKIFN
jgi:hypothetical protein